MSDGFYQTNFMLVLGGVLAVILTFIMVSVRKTVNMVFADPYDKDYKRKTDKELYSFVMWSCVTAFIFAVLSFSIIYYITLLFWFYFIIFMLMFSTIWKFHGKKRRYLFLILFITIIISFFAAPFIRGAILDLLHYWNIY